MSNRHEGVEMNTRKAGRPGGYTHAANRDKLRERLPFIAPDVRALILNFIEANARHWYIHAGGNVAEFEMLFNQEKHAEQ